jgi:hypothetical protein
MQPVGGLQREQVGGDPSAAYARQLKGLGSYGEDLSAVALQTLFRLELCRGEERKELSESSPARSAGK